MVVSNAVAGSASLVTVRGDNLKAGRMAAARTRLCRQAPTAVQMVNHARAFALDWAKRIRRIGRSEWVWRLGDSEME